MPRQPYVARGHTGVIELARGNNFEDALCDLDEWSHIWVLFVFHLNNEWRPKVLPPRSRGAKRGVFSTRSPYRPNPIGMSVLKLIRVDGLFVHVEGVDMVDETPILDIKPYVPFADAIADAGTGWIAKDPEPPWRVRWTPEAWAQREWLEARGELIGAPLERALSLGPAPHAYRRIRATATGQEIAQQEWRADFVAGDREITVTGLRSGFRGDQWELAPRLHREFRAVFGPRS